MKKSHNSSTSVLSKAAFKQLFNEYICAELTRSKEICAKYTTTIDHAFEHAIWRQAIEPYERPYYAYLGFKAYGGKDVKEVIDLCVALELYNMALLIHDDVFDQDTVRNGQQNIYGLLIEEAKSSDTTVKDAESAAILVGNLLFGLAFAKLDDLHCSEKIKKNLREVMLEANMLLNLGQLVDMRVGFDQIETLSIDRIAAGYDLKNQFNVEMPLQMGAIFAGGRPVWSGDFARPLGIAIQIVNDNDLLRSNKFDEKTITDLRNSKPTLLTFLTWHKCNNKDKQFIASLMGSKNIKRQDVDNLKAIIEATGSLKESGELCLQYCRQSEAALRQKTLPPDVAAVLLEVVDKVKNRAQ